MTHPSSLDLEAFACGETAILPQVGEHLDTCEACRGFVERLGTLAAAGPSLAEAEALIARARAESTPPRAPVRRFDEAREGGAKNPRARSWLALATGIAPLAAAAAVLLLFRSGGVTPPNAAPSAETTASPADRIQMASGIKMPEEPETTFKGGVQVAVVRERRGEQMRFASGVKVRPGDRLRLEVALDREQAILAAVLADDGSYLELMPLAVRGPGTHFSERSARIDEAPTYGTIVIGTPEAVARARATRQLDGVATLRVEGDGP